MHEFIAALRELRRPLVTLAAAVLLLQTLVAGIAGAHAVAQNAALRADAGVICHGNGEDSSAPAATVAHGCCAFCGNPGPITLSAADAPMIARLTPERCSQQADRSADISAERRAIRDGPSQAPPTSPDPT